MTIQDENRALEAPRTHGLKEGDGSAVHLHAPAW
jgi:hypothetical protein